MQTLADAHAGPDASYYGDNPDWFVSLAVTRDADVLDRANFAELLDRLEDVNEWTIERSGHWAVGWIDVIVVKPGSDAVAIVEQAQREIADYPVLDDERYSEMETDDALKTCAEALEHWAWNKHGDATGDQQAIAAYILDVAENMGRGVGYYGSADFWPDDSAITFGYLAYRRANS